MTRGRQLHSRKRRNSRLNNRKRRAKKMSNNASEEMKRRIESGEFGSPKRPDMQMVNDAWADLLRPKCRDWGRVPSSIQLLECGQGVVRRWHLTAEPKRISQFHLEARSSSSTETPNQVPDNPNSIWSTCPMTTRN